MGLITKEVEVGINNNVKYYESLGYKIPKYFNKNNNRYMVKQGTKIKVKVEHLTLSSNVLVDIECDCCGKQLKRTYSDYNHRLHDGKCYCKKCGKMILNSGNNNGNYNPNKTDEERADDRSYPEYIEFIKSVLARDNYTCQCCGNKDISGTAEVHHLYGYLGFPQYRIDQTQSITLCKTCHKAFHNWHCIKYGHKNKGNCTREQYEEWIGYALEQLGIYDGILSTARKVYDYETGIIYDNATICADVLNISNTFVYDCCNHKTHMKKYLNKNGEVRHFETRVLSVKGHHLFWLDEYENLTKDEINNYVRAKHRRYNDVPKNKIKNNNSKPIYRKVVCITTGEIFEKIKFGGEKHGLKSIYKISENCNGSVKSAGKLPDGTKLVWMYYEDFLKLPKEEQNIILARNQESSNDGSFIMK